MNEFGLILIMMSDGNPGCMAAVSELLALDAERGLEACNRMLRANITGAKLYMLWNDCCDRDTAKTLDIMLTHDISDIKEHINYEGGRGIPYDEQ